MAATLPSDGNLWSGVNVNKCFAFLPTPVVDYKKVLQALTDVEKTPASFIPKLIEQLLVGHPEGEVFNTAFGDYSPDALLPKLKAHFNSAYSGQFKEHLFTLYARMTRKLDQGFEMPPVTESEMLVIRQKLLEGLFHCSEGFLSRTSELVKNLGKSGSWGHALQSFREELVGRALQSRPRERDEAGRLELDGHGHAIDKRGDVHMRAYYFQVASNIYGVPFIKDPHVVGFSYYIRRATGIKTALAETFRQEFHFLGALEGLLNWLKGELLEADYHGRITEEGKSLELAQINAIKTVLQQYFGLTSPDEIDGDWFIEKDYLMVDISWEKIVKTLISQLLDGQFFRLNAFDLTVLKDAGLYDGNAQPQANTQGMLDCPQVSFSHRTAFLGLLGKLQKVQEEQVDEESARVDEYRVSEPVTRQPPLTPLMDQVSRGGLIYRPGMNLHFYSCAA